MPVSLLVPGGTGGRGQLHLSWGLVGVGRAVPAGQRTDPTEPREVILRNSFCRSAELQLGRAERTGSGIGPIRTDCMDGSKPSACPVHRERGVPPGQKDEFKEVASFLKLQQFSFYELSDHLTVDTSSNQCFLTFTFFYLSLHS